MSDSPNNSLNLFKVTSLFTLFFLVIAAGFLVYSINRYAQQKPETKYLSSVDMRILNHVIAPAIVPVSNGQEIEKITASTMTKSLGQYPACLAAFNKHTKIDIVAGRLQQLQSYVTNYTAKPQINNQTPYTFSLQKWTDYACQMLGKVDETTRLQITASHMASTLKQIANSKDLLAQGNAYWCAKYPHQQSCDTPNYHVQFSQKILAVTNPWSGLKGCLLLGNPQGDYYYLSGRKGNSQINDNINKICSTITNTNSAKPIIEQNLQTVAIDDLAWALPPSYADIIQPMQALRQPQSLYVPTEKGDFEDVMEKNTITLNDKKQAIGLHTELTIVPNTQKTLQQIAMCYTGNQKICDALGLGGAVKNQDFYENAVVRKVGMVVLDIKTGEIDALASAHSACFEQNSQGLSGGDDCPVPSYNIKAVPDKLRNHAYFDEAPPASTLKPLMAVTLLQDAANQDVDALGIELAHSNSVQFLRRMLCLNSSKNSTDCQLPQQMQKTAIAMGWDSNCYTSNEALDPKNTSYDCGKIDTLWGKKSPIDLGDYNRDKLADKTQLYGWFMVQKEDSPKTLRTNFNFTVDKSKPTAGEAWYTKQTYSVRDLTSQGLGQGESLSTPVGVAGMIANLALAAQAQNKQILPHVIRRVFDVTGNTPKILENTQADYIDISLPSDKAAIVINKMQGSHQQPKGTANKACQAVLDATTCQTLSTVAGKTGTPTISDEQNTQAVLKARKDKPCRSNCTYPPYKWYVAAYQSQGDKTQPYDKVIAVLVERNWTKQGNLTPDLTMNHAAQIAFRAFKNLGVVKAEEQAPVTTQRSKK